MLSPMAMHCRVSLAMGGQSSCSTERACATDLGRVPESTRSERRIKLLPLLLATVAASAAAAAAGAFVPCCRPGLQLAPSPRGQYPWVSATFRALATRRAAETGTEEAEANILGELLELAATNQGEALAARVDADFGSISPEDLSELQMMIAKGGSEAEHAQAVAAGVQSALDQRMTSAKDAIEDLIANSQGDVNLGIRKCLKKQDSPLPLLIVLQLNVEQAKTDGEEDKLRALLHINTVINEELEKKVSRVRGLVNKLLRMDDASIRENLLRHHLTPVQVAAPPDDDLDIGEPQLTAALVPPGRLASTISQLVGDIDRQLRVAVGEDDEGRFDMLERIRIIAKEARLIIGDIYGEGEMNAFGADLTPAFTALMTYKAKMEQSQPVEQADALPPTEPLPPAAPVQA